MRNRVTYFEIPCDDPKKTMDFFATVFNWSFRKFEDEEYWFARTGSDEHAGINGAIMKKRDRGQPITHSIQVDDLDRTIRNITNTGGAIVMPKMAIPEMGWLSFFKDPDGNIHGIWKNDPAAK